MKTRILGKAKVSDNMTISLIAQIRPFLEVQSGDYVVFIQDPQGHLLLEKEMTAKKRGITP
jgi:hypothetical protein